MVERERAPDQPKPPTFDSIPSPRPPFPLAKDKGTQECSLLNTIRSYSKNVESNR